MPKHKSLRSLLRIAVLICALGLTAESALAEQVVVRRHVTVRESPASNSRKLLYPAVGTRLELLDNGAKVRGYYHVRLDDGRVGWVYENFVRREDEAVPPAALATMVAHYVNVDQGAAALLEFSCGAILIDAGGRGPGAKAHLLDYLDAFFERRTDLHRTLNAVFITHAHLDHDLSLEAVASAFTIDGLIFNGVETSRVHRVIAQLPATVAPVAIAQDRFATTGSQGLTNASIDPLSCPDADPRIRVLAGHRVHVPGRQHEDLGNPNNHSLVIRVDLGESSFLFTGDLMVPSIEALVEKYGGSSTLDVDVYTVGHHGADNGTTTSLLAAMTPEIAIISSGDPDPALLSMSAFDHGHPRRSTLDLLDASIPRTRTPAGNVAVFDAQNTVSQNRPEEKAVYVTASDGDLDVIATSSGAIEVRTHPSH